MTDIIDAAQEKTEQLLQGEIESARKHLAESPKATGSCLFCGEPLEEPDRRFCDKYCAEDAEKYGTIDGGYIPVSDQTRIQRGQYPKHLIR